MARTTLSRPTADSAAAAPNPARAVPRLLIAFLLILAFLWRTAGIVRSIWFDEGYSIYFAGVSPLETARLTALDIHPPLYYWLLQAWTFVFGWNVISIPLFSIACGLATVALVYWLARPLFGGRGALCALVVLAFSGLHIYYSQELRMYALLALWSTLLVGAWLRIGQRHWFVVAVVAGAAALLTQYYAAFLFVALALTIPVLGNWQRRLLALVLAGLPGLVWALYAVPQLLTYVRSKVAFEGYPPLAPWEFLAALGKASGGVTPWAAWAAVPLAVLAVFGFVALRARDRLTFGILLGVPLLIGWLVNLVFPFHPPDWERLYLFLLPLWLVLAGGGFAWLFGLVFRRDAEQWTRRAALACAVLPLVLCVVTVMSYFTLRPNAPDEDPRRYLSRIYALSDPADLFLATYPWQIGYLRYYAPRPLPEIRLIPASEWFADPARRSADLDAAIKPGQRVWFPAYTRLGQGLENQLLADFDQRLSYADLFWQGDTQLWLYANGGGAMKTGATGVFAGPPIQLMSSQITASPVETAFGSVLVDTQWRGLFDAKQRFALRLEDDAGNIWSVNDSEMRPNTMLHRVVWVPPGTPPGTYHVIATVSRREFQDQSGTQPRGLDIGTVTVVPTKRPVPVAGLFSQRPLNIEFPGGLRLLGVSGAESGVPGGELRIALDWLATEPQQPGRSVTINGGAAPVSGPPGGAYPADQWPVGQPVREYRTVRIPAGPKLVNEAVNDAGVRFGGLPLTIEVDGRSAPLALPEVKYPPRTAPVAPVQTLVATLGTAVHLVGGSLLTSPTLLPAGKLLPDTNVRLFWRTDVPLTDNYRVFVHLVDADGRPLAQHDGEPGGGNAPTAGWQPGETIVDDHPLTIPADLPSGTYRIIAGLYLPPNGARLAVSGPDAVPGLEAALVAQVTWP